MILIVYHNWNDSDFNENWMANSQVTCTAHVQTVDNNRPLVVSKSQLQF